MTVAHFPTAVQPGDQVVTADQPLRVAPAAQSLRPGMPVIAPSPAGIRSG